MNFWQLQIYILKTEISEMRGIVMTSMQMEQ